jgi:hypothetical protein
VFVVEYGAECYCRDGLKAGSVAEEATDCNMNCAGSAKEFCGARDRSNIYQRP